MDLRQAVSHALGIPPSSVRVSRSSARSVHVMDPYDRKKDVTVHQNAQFTISIDEIYVMGRDFGKQEPQTFRVNAPTLPPGAVACKPYGHPECANHWTLAPIYREDSAEPVVGARCPYEPKGKNQQ